MVDLHNHGGAGHSFPTSEIAGCRTAAAHHQSRGTTTMLASLVSADASDLITQAAVLAELAEEQLIAGIHLEGPFLSAVRCGAQDPAALTPADPDLLTHIVEVSRGQLRSITIAPEVEGFEEVVNVCAEHGVLVSLGHSDASAAETEAALSVAEEFGVPVSATHLFNAMPTMHHRHPGIAGALLRAASAGRVVAELVADGVHLDDTAVDIALAAAPNNVAFISDAMAAAGKGDGSYTLGDAAVRVDHGVARLSAPGSGQGSVAGGTSSLVDQLLRHAGNSLVSGRIESADSLTRSARAVRSCTRTPAEVMGLHDRGVLAAGRRADVVTLDSQGHVAGVLDQIREQQWCVG
ncbi:MAG: N-acetylglucosamine-6-phosphate deacetylase [Nesterenkonia sp.]